MDKTLRMAQLKLLKVFSKEAKSFALCGGTALEIFYLKHRFSLDLDFFSRNLDYTEIKHLISKFNKALKCKFKLESDLLLPSRAKLQIYTVKIKGIPRPLKVDFVEEVLIDKPNIKKIDGVRVYSKADIYLQKIAAIAGTQVEVDEIGRAFLQGRREAKDIFDLYMLSKKVMPLHIFLKQLNNQLRMGLIHWYRTFSRQDLKLGLLDLDIYIKDFDAQKMIIYLEDEIKKFVKEVTR